MEMRQLKYFIAVAEEGNISRAAERLHISQPPLTRQMQALETELGVQLFKRTSWGVELTQAGAMLLEHARNIRAHVELASHQARQIGQGLLGRIDVGVYGSAMLNVIPRLLNDFALAHPKVEVVLQNAPKLRQLEALGQGRILIAFDRNLPASEDIRVELVDREPAMVALNARHPLAAEASIELAALRDEVFIGELQPNSFAGLDEAFARCGFQPRITQRAADMIAATVMVAGGFGTCIVPASMSKLQMAEVCYRPLETPVPAFAELHCAYRPDETSPLLAEMLATVRGHRTSVDIELPK